MTDPFPSVLVMGTGRSGTSTIAQVLNEKMGVCMGHYLHHRESQEWGGQYEDIVAHAISRMVVNDGFDPGHWLKHVQHVHRDHGCKLWGVKDPWFTLWGSDSLEAVSPSLIIWARRPIDETVESWIRLRVRRSERYKSESPSDEKITEWRSELRELCLERYEGAYDISQNGFNSIAIDMTSERRVSDEELMATIKEAQ